MQNFTFNEKLEIILNTTKSSPLFICCFFGAIALLIFYLVMIILNKKINKKVFLILGGLILFLMIFKYNKVFIDLIDSLFDALFMALYFPNLIVYVGILVISNFLFVYSILSKKERKAYKIINTLSALIIDTFLVLIIDIVSKNGINLHNEITMYTNPNLLVLLEMTTSIFVSWLLLNLFFTAKYKLEKYDKKEYPEMPTIIFD